MGKNDFTTEAYRVLTYGELVNPFRACDIFTNYRIKEEIMRQSATVDFANHTGGDLRGQGFRGQFLKYLRGLIGLRKMS